MINKRKNRIEIRWQELFKPIPGLQAGPRSEPVINEIVIEPEIIPIIFVPGIMGSRLKYAKGDKIAWDPDGKLFMLNHYGRFSLEPEERKSKLIGEHSHHPEFLQVCEDSRKIPKGTRERGWGSVAWGFYGGIINALEMRDWPEPLHPCFDLPVYAFGYNWTNSNAESGAKLKTFIHETIENNAEKHPCKHVILVTHSMGGLVARAACKDAGLADKVLGVVHGAQPATGSPAAYMRMKSGFEPPGSPTGKAWDWLRNPLKMADYKSKGHGSRNVLGKSGEEVTILMANMPGGLELLPNKLYKTDDGSRQWLRFTNRHGSTVDLPKNDPYTEIYAKKENACRLVNESWLGSQSTQGYDQEAHSAWGDYIKNITKASRFHDDLNGAFHPESFQFYSTDIRTADKVEVKCDRVKDKFDIYAKAHRNMGFLEVVDQKGHIQSKDDLLYVSAFQETSYNYKDSILYAFTLSEPKGLGDGTVPDCSGRALDVKPTGYPHGPDGTVNIGESDENGFDRQHDGIFATKTAQTITLTAVENLCKTKIKRETGY